jgi:amino acid transporter
MATAAVAASLALGWTLLITAAVVIVVVLIGRGYTYVINYYRQGGGSYAVARSQLGRGTPLVAASALLVDYVLTVAVSTSSAVYQLTSSVPVLRPYTVELCAGAVVIFVWLNLRGLHKLAPVLMGIVTFFLVTMGSLVVVGLVRLLILHNLPLVYATPQVTADHPSIGAFLFAFAAGAVALTGLESISNGVQIFKNDSRVSNAQRANRAMWVLILVIVLITPSIAALAIHGNVHVGDISALVQISGMVFAGFPTIAGWNIFASLPVISTAVLLLAAVQTSFTSAPQLTNLLGRHGFMPRQFSDRWSRMAFGSGVWLVGLASIALLVLFRGDTQALIPLYSIGVFVGFSIALFGLLVMFWRNRAQTARGTYLTQMIICGVAFAAAFTVLVIQIKEKLVEGGFLTLGAIVVLWLVMSRMNYHYRHSQGALEKIPQPDVQPLPRKIAAFVGPIDARLAVMLREAYDSGATKDQIRFVHVSPNDRARQAWLADWDQRPIGTEFSRDHVRVIIDQHRDVPRRVREYVLKNHVVGEDHFQVIVCQTAQKNILDALLHHHMGASIARAINDIEGVSSIITSYVSEVPEGNMLHRWLGAIFQGPTLRTDEAVEH